MPHRRAVNKKRSSRKFRGSVRKTARANMAKPGRGGFRM